MELIKRCFELFQSCQCHQKNLLVRDWNQVHISTTYLSQIHLHIFLLIIATSPKLFPHIWCSPYFHTYFFLPLCIPHIVSITPTILSEELHNLPHFSIISPLTSCLNKLWWWPYRKIPIQRCYSWFFCTAITVTARTVVPCNRALIRPTVQSSVRAPVCVWTNFFTLSWW